MRKIAGEVNPADLYTKHLESRAKIEQLVGLFGGEFRDGRPEAAPQLRQDPAVAGMVEILHSATESGNVPEMRILPHLMDREEMDRFFEIASVHERVGEHDEAKPAEELADPGPRGRLEFTPAVFRDCALLIETIDDSDDGDDDGDGDRRDDDRRDDDDDADNDHSHRDHSNCNRDCEHTHLDSAARALVSRQLHPKDEVQLQGSIDRGTNQERSTRNVL